MNILVIIHFTLLLDLCIEMALCIMFRIVYAMLFLLSTLKKKPTIGMYYIFKDSFKVFPLREWYTSRRR